jgi:hypothetical protein
MMSTLVNNSAATTGTNQCLARGIGNRRPPAAAAAPYRTAPVYVRHLYYPWQVWHFGFARLGYHHVALLGSGTELSSNNVVVPRYIDLVDWFHLSRFNSVPARLHRAQGALAVRIRPTPQDPRPGPAGGGC